MTGAIIAALLVAAVLGLPHLAARLRAAHDAEQRRIRDETTFEAPEDC